MRVGSTTDFVDADCTTYSCSHSTGTGAYVNRTGIVLDGLLILRVHLSSLARIQADVFHRSKYVVINIIDGQVACYACFNAATCRSSNTCTNIQDVLFGICLNSYIAQFQGQLFAIICAIDKGLGFLGDVGSSHTHRAADAETLHVHIAGQKIRAGGNAVFAFSIHIYASGLFSILNGGIGHGSFGLQSDIAGCTAALDVYVIGIAQSHTNSNGHTGGILIAGADSNILAVCTLLHVDSAVIQAGNKLLLLLVLFIAVIIADLGVSNSAANSDLAAISQIQTAGNSFLLAGICSFNADAFCISKGVILCVALAVVIGINNCFYIVSAGVLSNAAVSLNGNVFVELSTYTKGPAVAVVIGLHLDGRRIDITAIDVGTCDIALAVNGYVYTNTDSITSIITACTNNVNQLVVRFSCNRQLLSCYLAVLQLGLDAVIGSKAAAAATCLNRQAVLITVPVYAKAAAQTEHKGIALSIDAGVFSSFDGRAINNGIIIIFDIALYNGCRSTHVACISLDKAYSSSDHPIAASAVGKLVAIVVHAAVLGLGTRACVRGILTQGLIHFFFQIRSCNLGIICQLILVNLKIAYTAIRFVKQI